MNREQILNSIKDDRAKIKTILVDLLLQPELQHFNEKERTYFSIIYSKTTLHEITDGAIPEGMSAIKLDNFIGPLLYSEKEANSEDFLLIRNIMEISLMTQMKFMYGRLNLINKSMIIRELLMSDMK